MCLICFILNGEASANVLLKTFGSQLPPFDSTFFLPDIADLVAREQNAHEKAMFRELVDQNAYRFFPEQVLKQTRKGEMRMLPLKTVGDGNCLPRAISRYLWGSEHWHLLLRQAMAREMEEHHVFYKEYLGRYDMEGEGEVKFDVEQSEWDRVMREARSNDISGSLQGIHLFALCHVIRRPIILFCSEQFRSVRGEGVGGVAGTYIPIRLRPEECVSKEPVAVAWANEVLHHYVPLVGMEHSLAPVWPLMHAAWQSFAGQLDAYICQTPGKKLSAAESVVVSGILENWQRMSESYPSHALKTTPSIEGLSLLDPMTVYDHNIIVVGRFYCSFNDGEDAEEVTNKFMANTPQLSAATGSAAELVEVREQLLALVKQRLSKKRDGAETGTPGVCDCGSKHWLDEVEYDLVICIPVAGGTSNKYVGWNWGDDVYAVVERFVVAHKAAQVRAPVLQMVLEKEHMVMMKQRIMAQHKEENVIMGTVPCKACKAPLPYGCFDAVVSCDKCKVQVASPIIRKARVSSCTSCNAPGPLFDGQRVRICTACKCAAFMIRCPKCDASLACSGAQMRFEMCCPKCRYDVPTGWPRIVFREEDPSKRLLPSLKPVMYTEKTTLKRIVEAILASNVALVGSGQELADEELAQLQQLAGMIEEGREEDFGSFSDVVTRRLMAWPAAHRFAVLDLLRIMLLNRAFLARAHRERVLDLVCAGGWGPGTDWRCRFNGLKCVCNYLPAVAHAPEAVLDRILALLSETFSAPGPVKDHELVAAAQTVYNFSTFFGPRPGAPDTEDISPPAQQIVTCLGTMFLPRAVVHRKTALQHAVVARAAQTELSKEAVASLQKADEMLVLLLQAFGNLLLAGEIPAQLQDDVSIEKVLTDLVDVDAMVPAAYLGVKPHISAGYVRSLLRDIIWFTLC
jgi:hypothetical protein